MRPIPSPVSRDAMTLLHKAQRLFEKAEKLDMVEHEGKKVPAFAADGKGAKDLGKAKMMKGGRVKKMGGGISKLNPGLQAFMKKKMKKKM